MLGFSMRGILFVALLGFACGRSPADRVPLTCPSDADCEAGDNCHAGFCPRGAEFSGPPVALKSTLVVATPGPLPASGKTNAGILVTIRDSSGIPVAGQVVTLASSGTNNSFTPASQTVKTNF